MPAWTELSSVIRVRQSRAFRMNTTVMLDPEHAVLVDPGVLPSELDELAATVARERVAHVTLCFTHADWDHVLGRPWWPEAGTLAHDTFAAEVARRAREIEAEAVELADAHGERWARPFQPFTPETAVAGQRFLKLGPWRLVVRDAPGHSDSQISLHFPESRLLLCGDMLSDIEMPTLNSPSRVYRQTLESLRPLVEGGAIETLVPGHGSLARGVQAVGSRLQADLDYLSALERGVEAAVHAGLSLEATQERLAAMDYSGKRSTEYPTEPLHRQNVALTFRDAARIPAP